MMAFMLLTRMLFNLGMVLLGCLRALADFFYMLFSNFFVNPNVA